MAKVNTHPVLSNRTEIFWQGRYFVATEEKAWDFVSDIIEDRDLISMTSHDHDMIEIWSSSDAQVPIHNEYINKICITSPRRANSSDSKTSSHEIKTWAKNTRAITLALPPCEWSEMLGWHSGRNKQMKNAPWRHWKKNINSGVVFLELLSRNLLVWRICEANFGSSKSPTLYHPSVHTI